MHRLKLTSCLIFFLFICLPHPLVQAVEPPDGYTHDEAMRLGEQMYRNGILPSGNPMQALVMGDIPFDGRMFTCDDCHQRSGLGTEEGSVITWPTNGKMLLLPRKRTGAFRQPTSDAEKQNARRTLPPYFQVEDERPPYDERSLANALRVGKDSGGRSLDPIMPKYRLSNSSMAILTYYLMHLSVDFAPGVDDEVLHFATVIAGDVPEEKKTAMLSVLQTHIDNHNSQGRHESRRAASGPFFKSEAHQAYRKLKLHVWELTGTEETWHEQLEGYYRDQPVFALLGGISEGPWQKIHGFSEKNRIPCILPITDQPVLSDTDWYTLYFSKGVSLEGETAAKYVRAGLSMKGTIMARQIYRRGNTKAAALAEGFSTAWKSIAGQEVQQLVLGEDDELSDQALNDLLDSPEPVVLLAWLDSTDKEAFKILGRHGGRAAMVFASSTMLNNDFSAIPDALKENLLVTYPHSLPSEDQKSRFAVEQWLRARKIPAGDFDIQAKMYFLGWMLSGGIKSMRSEFYRDYFLEGFDMMIDQDYAIAVYPRLTFGPGQRYSSKGCYIVRLSSGSNPELIPVSDWVIY